MNDGTYIDILYTAYWNSGARGRGGFEWVRGSVKGLLNLLVYFQHVEITKFFIMFDNRSMACLLQGGC